MDVGETMVWVVRHTLRTCLRGMALALTAVAALPLFPASVACVLLLPTGLGVVLAPKSLLAVRRQAERQRRWALDWSGVTIAAPYRSRSAKPVQPADAGVPALRVGSGRPGDLAGSALDAGQRAGQRGPGAGARLSCWSPSRGPWWPITEPWSTAGAAPRRTGSCCRSSCSACSRPASIAGPWLLKIRAIASSSLLAPTRKEMAARVGELTESRWDAVDASAAELRRIERDLHDGAQARLVALGMNIGFAEQMVRENPDLALTLLAEARESSGQALSELRALVRGIHPPALAERGLDGAVRALALGLPAPGRRAHRSARPPQRAGRVGRLLRHRRGARQRGQAQRREPGLGPARIRPRPAGRDRRRQRRAAAPTRARAAGCRASSGG